MSIPTSPFGNSTTADSQGALIPLPLNQEDSLEVQTDQISQTIFTMHNTDRQASNHVQSSEQEKKTSKDQISRKRARIDDVITQGTVKRFRRKEEEMENQNLSISDENSNESKFKKGMPNDHGKDTLTDGTLEDEVKDDKANGLGKMTNPDGSLFEGEVKDGKANGRGKRTYPAGNVFEGEYKDGNRNGHGTLTYPDGIVFEGEYKDGN